MFDFMIPVAIFGFGGYFFYKILELYAMRSERKTIIERLDLDGLIEYVRHMPIGIGGGNIKAECNDHMKNIPSFKPLRWGLAAMGLGIGFICGYFISQNGFDGSVSDVRDQFEVVWFASACSGIGLGLLLSFIIETIIVKKSK